LLIFYTYVKYVGQACGFALERDESKRQKPLIARRINFADMALFDWDTALTRIDRRWDYGEARVSLIGHIKGKLRVCIWCWRGDVVRMISLTS